MLVRLALALCLIVGVGCSTPIGPTEDAAPPPVRRAMGGAGLAQGQYLSSPPSLTNAAVAPLLLDGSGRLVVATVGASAGNDLSLSSQATLTGTSAAVHPWSAETTPGYLTIGVDSGASASCYLGGSSVSGTTNGYALVAGSSITLRLANPSTAYVFCTTGDKAGWLVTR